jgi:UDP-glucuronate 4-epimerase
MRRRVLITGANGYLGAACVERFAHDGRQVMGIWHRGSDRLLTPAPPCVRYERCDLADPHAVTALFDRWRANAVVHAAAVLPDGAPAYLSRAAQANVWATARLVECAVAVGVQRFVYCSSINVYGATPCPASGWTEEMVPNPSSPYGWSKYAGEECVRLASDAPGASAISVRLAGVHGAGRRAGVAFNIAQAAMEGRPFTPDGAEQRFQLVFLDDAVNALARAVDCELGDRYAVVNVASHSFSSLGELASCVAARGDVRDRARSPAAAGYVMETSRMRTLLGFEPDRLERQIGKLLDYAARPREARAGAAPQ